MELDGLEDERIEHNLMMTGDDGGDGGDDLRLWSSRAEMTEITDDGLMRAPQAGGSRMFLTPPSSYRLPYGVHGAIW